MDADPKVQRAAGRLTAAVEFALDLDRALDGLNDRGKLGDQAVAGGVGDPSVMAFDQLGNTPRAARRASSVPSSSASILRL